MRNWYYNKNIPNVINIKSEIELYLALEKPELNHFRR